MSKWVERVSNPDPLNSEDPKRALRPATVKDRVMGIRCFASALFHRDAVAIPDFTGLDVFFEVERFKSSLRFFLARAKDKEPTQNVAALASDLRFIAKYHCRIDEARLKELNAICDNLNRGNVRQMAPRNRERLRQFDDPAKVTALLRFPSEERKRAGKCRSQIRQAHAMERAIGIELLIHTCLRIQNLRTINLQTDLKRIGPVFYLSILAERVKNKQLLEFELPDEVSKALGEFIDLYRPRIKGSERPYLFAGKGGKPKAGNSLRYGLEKTLLENAGLQMHPHLFRHAIAKIVVEQDPGAYAVISRHLGHKRMDMTLGSYLGTETRAAGRHINKLLENAKAKKGNANG